MKKVKLGDLVGVYGGGTPRRTNPAFYGGSIPWVTPKDMKSWIIADSSVRITEAGVHSSPAKLISAGSVLLVVRSGVLKHTLPVALTTAPVTVNQDMKALTPSLDVFAPYLARLIKSMQPTILSWVRATTADNFPIQNLLDEVVSLPPLDEQCRIAAILDQADAVRARRRQSIAQLDDLPRAIFLEMFGGMAEGLRSVGGVASQEKGSIRTGPFGSQLLHSEFIDEGVAVLGIDNVVTNRFRWHGRRHVAPEKYQKLKRYTVVPGDVLITIMGTCGRCVVVPEDIPTAINTKHICAITVDRAQLLPEFLRGCFLWHPVSRRFLLQRAKGSIMDGLNMGIIKEMPMPVPPLGLQAEFVRRAHAAERAFEVATRSEREIEELFSALQSRAFAGQL